MNILRALLKHRWPLRYTVPVLLGLLGLTLTLIAFYDGWQSTRGVVETEMLGQTVALGTRIAGLIEDHYARGDVQPAAELVLRMVNERHLERASLIAADGTVLTSTDHRLRGTRLDDWAAHGIDLAKLMAAAAATSAAQHGWSADRDRLYGVFPVRLERQSTALRSQRVGALLLEFNLEEIKRIYLSRHIRRMWLMTGVIVVSLLLLWWYLDRVVTRRLTDLAEAIEHTAQGADVDDEKLAEVDELGRFGATIRRIVAELHKRTDALRASEAHYRSVIHAMSEGVLLYDARGCIVAANESAQRIIGMAAAELTKHTADDPPWQALDERGRPLPVEDWPPLKTLRGGATLTQRIVGLRRADGELRWLTVNCEPITLEGAPSSVAQ